MKLNWKGKVAQLNFLQYIEEKKFGQIWVRLLNRYAIKGDWFVKSLREK